MAPTTPRKVEYLDGLRGIAALVVVFAHFKELVLPDTSLEGTPLMPLVASSLAVLIFFVHSGFVLSWKYLNSPDHRVLVSMAARRAFRLGIPVAASVSFSFFLMRLGFMSSEALHGLYDFAPTFTSAVEDSLGGALILGSVRYNGALWTMPVELFCSYLVFLILPLVAKTTTRRLLIALGVVSLALVFSIHNVACFLIGIGLVRCYQESFFQRGPLNSKTTGALVIVAALVLMIYPSTGKALQVLCAALVVLIVFSRPGIQRFLGSPVVGYLGKLSFSAYLVHLPILCSFSHWLFMKLLAWTTYGVAVLLTFVATVPLVYLAAWIMTVTVDQRAINFGKKTMVRLQYSALSHQ